MKIYRSLKSDIITQLFGENKCNFYKQLGMKGHNGWDWFAKDGEPIYWDCDIRGRVIYISDDPSAGFGVVVLTQERKMYKHIFWHLKGFACKVGQVLESGDIIGYADNTGKYTTGTHLHRGIKECVKTERGYITINHDNGYFGGIDIAPFWGGDIFIRDLMTNLEGQVSILRKMVSLISNFLKGHKSK